MWTCIEKKRAEVIYRMRVDLLVFRQFLKQTALMGKKTGKGH